MGSIGHVARCIPRVTFTCVAGVAVAIAGVAVAIAGITITVASTTITVVDHVAFVRRDHHRVVFGSKGPDQRIHVVFHPSRQVAPDGLGHRGEGGIKVKVVIGVLKMAEDAGKHAPEQAAAPLFNKLASSIRTILQVRHHVGEEAEVAGVVVCVGMRGIFIEIGRASCRERV